MTFFSKKCSKSGIFGNLADRPKILSKNRTFWRGPKNGQKMAIFCTPTFGQKHVFQMSINFRWFPHFWAGCFFTKNVEKVVPVFWQFFDPPKNQSCRVGYRPPFFWTPSKLRVWAANIPIFWPGRPKWPKPSKKWNFRIFGKIDHFLTLFDRFWPKLIKILQFHHEITRIRT